jgi:alpha/beta superfamily hydrolase
MRRQAITFLCGELTLQGYCYIPDKIGKFLGAVICHPHPLYSGSMDNVIVTGLAKALVNKDIVSLIFNFRGVGQSQGTYGEGIAEQDDITAAIDWLTKQSVVDKERVGLAGYSFGGGVSIPIACADKRIKALALISPVITDYTVDLLAGCNIPKIFITGENDDVIPSSIVEAAYNSSAEPKQFMIVPNADHFWRFYSGQAIDFAAEFMARELSSI